MNTLNQYYYYVQAINSLMSSAASATVSSATDPIFSVSGASSTGVGDTYTLTPTVNLNQSQSDPITSWNIDWGDTVSGSGGSSVSGDPSQFTHVYAKAGSYVIAATPGTANGPVDDTAFQDVIVNPPTPTLTLMRDTSSSGPTIVLDAAFDAHGATTTGDIIVNWGDGKTQGYDVAATATFSHTYADNEFNVGMNGAYYGQPGVCGATFNVTASILTSVNVTGAGITAGVSEYTTNVPDVLLLGARLNVRLGDAVNEENTWLLGVIAPEGSDGEVTTSGDGTTYPPFPSTFDWGDGSPPDTRTSSLFDDEKRSHTYLKEGTFGETFAGGESTSETAITVFGPPLTLSQPDPQTVEPGGSVNVTTSYTGLVGPGYAFVDWHDGKGPQALGGNLNSGGASLPTSGSLTARYARVPTSGLSGTFYLYDMHGNLVVQSFSVSCATDETLVTLNPEAVNNGKAGAELVGADKQTGIYVPKSNAANPKTGALIDNIPTQSPTSYWAPFVIHIGAGAKQDPLTFSIPPNVLVNTKGDGSGTQIKNRVPFPGLTDGQMLYVEATKVGSYAITVTDPLLKPAPLDTLNVTSFWMAGPNDVPQFGTYAYTASYPQGAAPAPSHWLSATKGDMTPIPLPNGNPTPNAAQVHWGNGPFVGTAVYEATANFSWHLNVNIVQIKIGTPVLNAFDPVTPYQVQLPNGGNAAALQADITGGLRWKATVTFISPGGNASIQHLKTGFLQNLKVTGYGGKYGPNNAVYVASIGGNSIVGNTYWDAQDKNIGKFYDPSGHPSGFFSGKDQINGKNNLINSEDGPEFKPVYQTTAGQLQTLIGVYDLYLYVAAITDEQPAVYVGQALAHWKIDGGGTFDNNDVKKWRGPSASVTKPTGWVPLTPDSVQPTTATTKFNALPPINFIPG